jgi:hypothetical protein
MTMFPQCFRCRHFHKGRSYTCDAYPAGNGIPESILTNEHDHREPFAGDGGIRFEPKNDEAPQ